MKIESVQETTFVVYAITTDYIAWLSNIIQYDTPDRMYQPDAACLKFARKQKAFMLAPTALFDNITYSARSILVDSLDELFIGGPLLNVYPVRVSDETAGKTVFQTYRDPTTFEEKHGLWYPQKTMYRVRYGVNIDKAVSVTSQGQALVDFGTKSEDGYNG
jgi:hypothetical protein